MTHRRQKTVFDTNIHISVLLAQGKDAKRFRSYILDTFTEVRSSVVLHELMRGTKHVRIDDSRSFKVNDWIATGPTPIEPNDKDWIIAGRAVQQLPNRDKDYLRKMSNDALIAAFCVRNEYALLTQDGDFSVLRQTAPLNTLKILPWDMVVNTYQLS